MYTKEHIITLKCLNIFFVASTRTLFSLLQSLRRHDLKKVLEDQPHLETDPLIAYGIGGCNILLDVKTEHEASIIAVEGNVQNTTHSVNRYEALLPSRKKKALISSTIFVVATFWSTVFVDSGIIVYLHETSVTKPLYSYFSRRCFLQFAPQELLILSETYNKISDRFLYIKTSS